MNCLSSCLLFAAAVNAAVPVFVEDATSKISAGFKKRGSRTQVQTIVVEWQPAELVVDKEDIDLSQPIVEIQSGDGDWKRLEESPVPRRGKYRATFEVAPCLSHKLRFIAKSLEGEEATYELPQVIGPASEEEIISSRFAPEAPTNVEVTDLQDGTLKVSWEPSECATSYEVYASGEKATTVTTQETSIILEDVEPCLTYEILVSAYTGEEVSDEVSLDFTTKPSELAANDLDLVIVPGVNSVSVSWDGWKSLSCVVSYTVNLCKDGVCNEPVSVVRNEYGGSSEFSSGDELEECSEYEVHVKPFYDPLDPLDLVPKIASFNTLSPDINDMEAQLGPVAAETGDDQMVNIKWSLVKCASSYEVFMKQNIDGSEWEPVDSVTSAELSTKGVPCTEYSYGVMLKVGEEQSGMVEADSPVEIPLDPSVPYHPPGLLTTPTETELHLSWDHSLCISGYRLKLCTGASQDCLESQVEVTDPSEHSISHSFNSLEPCTNYTLSIFATNNGKELEAEEITMSTLSPEPSPPDNVSVSLNPDTDTIEVSFSPVVCASGYRIHRRLGQEEEMEMLLDTSETNTSLPAPEPCHTFSVGVSAVVGGVESSLGDLVDGTVLPINGDTHSPQLEIMKAENMSVEFVVRPPPVNKICEVESYEVKYINLDVMSEPVIVNLQPSEDGTLFIEEFPGAGDRGMRIEARINYADGILSPWVSSKEPTIVDHKEEETSNLLVPVIVGIVVAVLVIAVILFVIIKRRKSQRKYDTESAKNEEESRKLKENSH